MGNPLIPGVHDMGAGVLGLFGFAIWGFFSLLSLSILIGLIFLLVRFLLVATRAAQLYVRKNEPPKVPAAPRPTPASPSTPAAIPATTPAAPTTPATPTATPASTLPSTPAPVKTAVLPTTPASPSAAAASAITEIIQKASGAPATAPMSTATTKVAPVVPKAAATETPTVTAPVAKAPTKPRTPKSPPTV